MKDRLNFVVLSLFVLLLAMFVAFFPFIEAKVAPLGIQSVNSVPVSSKPVGSQNPLPFCTSLRELPIPWAPLPQAVNFFHVFGKYIVYDLSPVPSHPQFDLVLLDMGDDLRLFTNDDGPMRLVNDTLDAWISDADLSNETLVWIQSVPAVLELRRCSLALCESNSSELIFTRNSFHDLQGKVAIGGLKIMWTVHEINRLPTKIMFCDLSLNGVAGGCLIKDSKKVIDLNLQFNENVRDIKTTENFGYVLTTINSQNRLKLYVIDYANDSVNLYYDQAYDKVFLRDFTPTKLSQGLDMVYLFYNGSVSTATIQQGNESFSGRLPLLSSGLIDTVAVDRNSNHPYGFAYLENNSKQPQSYELKTFVPSRVYNIDRTTYQQMKLMEYNGKSFVTFSKNWYPASMYCS